MATRKKLDLSKKNFWKKDVTMKDKIDAILGFALNGDYEIIYVYEATLAVALVKQIIIESQKIEVFLIKEKEKFSKDEIKKFFRKEFFLDSYPHFQTKEEYKFYISYVCQKYSSLTKEMWEVENLINDFLLDEHTLSEYESIITLISKALREINVTKEIEKLISSSKKNVLFLLDDLQKKNKFYDEKKHKIIHLPSELKKELIKAVAARDVLPFVMAATEYKDILFVTDVPCIKEELLLYEQEVILI